MAITKPIVAGYPDLKVVKKNEQVNLSLSENFEHLYTDAFTLAVGETYFTEALLAGEDTALFLWADNTLLLNGKNKIKYTNTSAGPMQIQLVIKLFSDSDENGTVLPAGNYAMYKGDTTYSDGTTGPSVPDRLCVNSRIYAVDSHNTPFVDDSYFGKSVFVGGNKVLVQADYYLYLYTSEGVFIDSYPLSPSSEFEYISVDCNFDEDGEGFIAIGQSEFDSGSGSGSQITYNIGKVTVLDQDLNLVKEILNPNQYLDSSQDYFGGSVAISSEGLLVVLASQEDSVVPNSGSGSGSSNLTPRIGFVYIFENIPSGIHSNVIEIGTEYPTYGDMGDYVIDAKGNGENAIIVISGMNISDGSTVIKVFNGHGIFQRELAVTLSGADGLFSNQVGLNDDGSLFFACGMGDNSTTGRNIVYNTTDGTEKYNFQLTSNVWCWYVGICGTQNEGYFIAAFAVDSGSGSGSGITEDYVDVYKVSDGSKISTFNLPTGYQSSDDARVSIQGTEQGGATIVISYPNSYTSAPEQDGEAYILCMSAEGVIDTSIMDAVTSGGASGGASGSGSGEEEGYS